MGYAKRRLDNLQRVRIHLLKAGVDGCTVAELVEVLGVNRSTVWSYLRELNVEQVDTGKRNTRWRYLPTREDIGLAKLLLNSADCKIMRSTKNKATNLYILGYQDAPGAIRVPNPFTCGDDDAFMVRISLVEVLRRVAECLDADRSQMWMFFTLVGVDEDVTSDYVRERQRDFEVRMNALPEKIRDFQLMLRPVPMVFAEVCIEAVYWSR